MSAPAPRPELIAFLNAIKAEPDDDTAKLVLADWLQEQPAKADQTRAEYIREYVRYSRLPEYDPGREDVALLNKLWTRGEKAWTGALADSGFRFLGFHSTQWGLLSPKLDGTKVVTKKALALAGTEEYAWVAGLTFHRIGDVQILKFVHSPLLDSLAGLSFNNCNAKLSMIAQVVISPRSAGLRELSFSKVPAPVAVIADAPHLAHLRELNCWFSPVSDNGFKALCNSPHLNELRSLTVSNAQLTIHSARAFADASGLPALTELDLGGTNRIGPDGALILFASKNAARLRGPNLWSNGIADYGVEALCRQAHVNRLTHLDVSGNLLTNRAAVAIAAAGHLAALEELHLNTNTISGDGALALAKSAHLKNIKRLDLSGNNIGAKVAGALRERFGAAVVID